MVKQYVKTTKGRGTLSDEIGPHVKIVQSDSKLSIVIRRTKKCREPQFSTHSDDKNGSHFTAHLYTLHASLLTARSIKIRFVMQSIWGNFLRSTTLPAELSL